jgi:carbamoyl-phosphate synthase large subunit
MFNILFTCAGRRNYLINYFREALGSRGEIMASDVSGSASAMQEADRAFVVPPVYHPDYFDHLLGLCRDYQVRLLLSLNDLELPLLARQREKFMAVGTIPVVSSPAVIDLCFDKLATWRFLEEKGVPVPRTFSLLKDVRAALDRGEIHFPLVVKPRWGTASIGIEYPENLEELELAWQLGHLRIMRSALAAPSAADREHCLLVQEKLTGAEYGMDVVNDLQGRYRQTFVKRKLAMRAGETDQAVTEKHPELGAIGRRIGETLGHIGNLDCDVFVDNDRYRVLELNPRFGGGYPFSHLGGVNLPAALIAWAENKEADPEWLSMRAGVAAGKCDRLVEVASGGIRPRIWQKGTAPAVLSHPQIFRRADSLPESIDSSCRPDI